MAASFPPHLPKFKEIADADYEQNYYENLVGIKALVFLLPHFQRKRILKWIGVLEGLASRPGQNKKRYLFTWYLFEQLREDAIAKPFDRDPNVEQLPDEHMLPQAVWFEFRNVVENMRAEADEMRKIDFHTPVKKQSTTVRPSNFIHRQPCPKTGFMAYGACFSNQYY